jgi:hypothetical protein
VTLREARCLFSVHIAELLIWINQQPGYAACFNEIYRTPREAMADAASGTGIADSLHPLGMAADINLYKNGVYQTGSGAHAFIGEKWKTMHPLARWGGDFRTKNGKMNPDGNHYSFEWQGRK